MLPSTRTRAKPERFASARTFSWRPFFSADDRGKKYEPLTLRQRHDPLDDLINGLLAYRLSADRAVRHAEACVKQAEVIVLSP